MIQLKVSLFPILSLNYNCNNRRATGSYQQELGAKNDIS